MLSVKICTSLKDLSPDSWNALVGEDQPFLEHSFLSLLETSNSVGQDAGWLPHHVIVEENDQIVAAMPVYLKDNSRGEFIFDWSWAEASMAAGIPYYPKLLVGVPFTPATGPRILVHPTKGKADVLPALMDGLKNLETISNANSTHILFCEREEAQLLNEFGYAQRTTHQYHWFNRGYRDFSDFLQSLRSRVRKQIKKERQQVADLELVIRRRVGDEISPVHWAEFDRLYRSTYARKWGSPYLTPSFFMDVGLKLGDRSLMVTAEQDGEVIAASLSFQKGAKLFGRYWGTQKPYNCLHFELCYYQLIEHAISTKKALIEAGAQGDHKVKRGFVPRPIYSCHSLVHAGLQAAIQDFVEREEQHTYALIDLISKHTPYRQSE